MKTYIGIDIGGMSIKGMIIDENGTILAEQVCGTGLEEGGKRMCLNIASLVTTLLTNSGADRANTTVGVGCPGLIDSEDGMIIFAGNLNLTNFPLAKTLEEMIGLPVKITNDANAAALGEAKFGAGKEYQNSILITLGTGVGGGIIIDGKLYEGSRSAGAEIGHMVIDYHGRRCTCGRRGCFETYSSASALIYKTQKAMEENPGSEMWKTYNLQTACGKTAFEYCQSDVAAREVITWYETYLACGICNLAAVFRPDVVMIGGGVSNQGERLTGPLQKLVNKELFGGCEYAPVKIVTASLGNKAGAFGAAALFMD